MKIKRINALLLLILLNVSSAYAQGQAVSGTAGAELNAGGLAAEAAPDDGTLYIISEIEFEVTGRSRRFALMYHGEFKEGEQILGKTNLERYITQRTQLLMNQLVLEEVKIEYFPDEVDEEGAVPVKLLVYVKDSRNLIALPYPQFDSNDGFSITIKARDYNFFGTMSTLRMDVGYRQDASNKVFNFMLDSDTPFRAFNLDWNVNFDHYFSYTLGEKLYYRNITGLSVELPWKKTTFTVGFDHYITINEEISDENKYLYHSNDNKTHYDPYAAINLYGSWKIPVGLEVGSFGPLTYTPKISGNINYPHSDMDEPRKPTASFSHSIGFGKTDWIGNFRKGLSASLGNSFTWYFDRSDAPLQITLQAETYVHWQLFKYLGISSRLNYSQWWQWSERDGKNIPYYYAGDKLRGVINDHLKADFMLSLNIDLPIRVLRFWPSEWFKTSKLEFFNVEVFFSPFLDLALLQGPYSRLKHDHHKSQADYEGTRFAFDDMVKTFGLEVIVYSGFFRSLRLRGSIGYNIPHASKNDCCVAHYVSGIPRRWGFFPQWNEIYIGLDLFY